MAKSWKRSSELAGTEGRIKAKDGTVFKQRFVYNAKEADIPDMLIIALHDIAEVNLKTRDQEKER